MITLVQVYLSIRTSMIERFFASLIVFIFLNVQPVNGQAIIDTIPEPDTIEIGTEKKKKGSIFSGRPGRSLLFSLVIPGAGQIYNKSYWRVPVVWAAVGGMGYVLVNNQRQYNCFREAYIDKVDGNTSLTLPHYCGTGDETIPLTDISVATLSMVEAPTVRRWRDQANVNRQWAIVGFTLVWLANGVDAFVDAHLKDFDIDEDLSIDIGPKIDNDPYAPMRLGIFVKL